MMTVRALKPDVHEPTLKDGFAPPIRIDGATTGTKFVTIGHLKRHAVVGAATWMKGLVSAIGPAMPFEMRFFAMTDEAAAREWIGWT